MRVLLINQYFWPDMAATAQLLTDLAEDLAAAGFEVTALSGRGSYARGRAGALPARERFGNIDVRRAWCTDFGRGSALGRMIDYATFMASAAAFVTFGRWPAAASAAARPPVVVCLSTPPLVAALGILAQARGARFVYKVEDLYPDVAVALGAFGARSLATRFFQRLSRLVLRRADAVVALDEGMRVTLAARGARRIEVIPNWADGRALAPDSAAGERFRRRHRLEERFVVLYSGNLGLAHRFDAVIAAARTLEQASEGAAAAPSPLGSAQGDNGPGVSPCTPGHERGSRRVLFLFVGAGPRLEEVRRACGGLPNVRFLPYQPRDTLRELYNAADLHLVTLRDEVSNLLVPSKTAAALACGKPVLLVGGRGSSVAAEIERHSVGWCCAHDPGEVAAVVRRAARGGGSAQEMAARARRLFEARYDRTMATTRWRTLLVEADGAGAGEALRG